ncbi:hypothetical protein BJ875DRAFT_482874 [Amylocarpus encephaloides]|uniref:Uncharacterized protein n=1 Tax=Amylocarpus encephaloides TaxID=45428 RepID=A0A9P8C861_9HELO|nr:hypothetical protein BJ875DRAFT_482874 [Amylocarpus encephaloides]
MDSKQPIPSNTYQDEDPAPPSYSASISASTYYSSQIRSQLGTLSSTITALESQKSLLASACDEKILSLLTTQIQIFLSDFANSGLKKGTLILVPRNGLTDDHAVPTDYDFKSEDEYDRVVRVRSKEDSPYDEFSSEPREMWFWRDEEMALRLAKHLKPPPDPRKAELPPRQEPVAPTPPAEASSSRGFWGRKKPSGKPPLITPPTPVYESRQDLESKNESPESSEGDDVVKMDVNAEEVVFRTENDFGIFGTERGWGIVLRLRVMMGDDRG